jgi:hypothetical protein
MTTVFQSRNELTTQLFEEPDDEPQKVGDEKDNDDVSVLSDDLIVPNYLDTRDNTTSEEHSSEEQPPSIKDGWIIIEEET